MYLNFLTYTQHLLFFKLGYLVVYLLIFFQKKISQPFLNKTNKMKYFLPLSIEKKSIKNFDNILKKFPRQNLNNSQIYQI